MCDSFTCDTLTGYFCLLMLFHCNNQPPLPSSELCFCQRKVIVTQKPSYTEQAKQYTAKGADILHGQAEYLKGKLVGTQGTGAPAVLRPSSLSANY